jgi:predicted acylesterase/phospholipase RssA
MAIAFGAGGVKGILHVGALLELGEREYTAVYGASIGSILATYVAFRLPRDKMVSLVCKYLSMDNFLPDCTSDTFQTAFSAKGLFTMDTFEASVVAMFADAGLDVRNATLGDAHIPLYIVASNITRGIPTLFSKAVPILDALKCSCCIPGLFRPISLYGQIYVDGGLFAPCLASVVPPGTLVLSLEKQRRHAITQDTLEAMSPLTYADELLTMTSHLFHNSTKTPTTICLSYPGLQSDSNLEDFDIPAILAHARNQTQMWRDSAPVLHTGFVTKV